MEVKRGDIYDFSVILDLPEFEQLKRIADRSKLEIEEAFAQILSAGLDIVEEDGL